jgi:formylglycine-generating enzyme required for sulfatase activity
MHGNVWEWCRDEYGDYAVQNRDGVEVRLVTGSAAFVQRGGSFASSARYARSSSRASHMPSVRSFFLGARAARAVIQAQPDATATRPR